MELIKGIRYNLRGLVMGLTTPKLLFLGMLRLVVVVILTVLCSALVIVWHEAILNILWKMPESGWLIFIWKGVSLILSVFLAAISGLFSYLLAQMLFAVFVMDYMSRITEKMVLGQGNGSSEYTLSYFRLFIYLVRQEIPRAIIPVLLMLFIMGLGFLTPLGPAVALASSVTAAAFLAWDNTDLVPARRMLTFSQRFGFFKKNILFHIGFGLCFLIPWVNILFLSFAPVGATLYFLDKEPT
ncbi:MAG: EI24 domain-containing protein [Desulfamplus sp.]|nr:EI24 domain-containing protein [Desulfamplus sp.]